MWYNWAETFQKAEQERLEKRSAPESGEEPEDNGEPGPSPSHGLLQGNIVHVEQRPGNKLDTEYKGPYRVVSEDAATRWRVLELANPVSGQKHWENTSNLV